MFRLTLVHPCIGRRVGERHGLRTWQMQPLWAAALAACTPSDVQLCFYDDRVEAIPFDEPTDAVGISVETYTARRAYQIASEYRRRGVLVIMGGIHATLCPEEVGQHAEIVVSGDAETTWPLLLDDLRHGVAKKFYRAPEPMPDFAKGSTAPSLKGLRYDRRIFRDKRYLPMDLVEYGRGCRLGCEFCAVQSAAHRTYGYRPVDEIVAELAAISRKRRTIFFVDDNLACEPERFKEFLRALIPLRIGWVGQAGINVAHDSELLELLARSGCRCLLIGFESLEPAALRTMNKPINELRGGIHAAVLELRRARVPVYGTFIFGFDGDRPENFDGSVQFSIESGFLLAAFAHLMPFPGTPLYSRLASEDRLLHRNWWLDPRYRYNTVAFQPKYTTPGELQARCLAARKAFFSWASILRRSRDAAHLAHPINFWTANLLLRSEVDLRNGHPLGDEEWTAPVLLSK